MNCNLGPLSSSICWALPWLISGEAFLVLKLETIVQVAEETTNDEKARYESIIVGLREWIIALEVEDEDEDDDKEGAKTLLLIDSLPWLLFLTFMM